MNWVVLTFYDLDGPETPVGVTSYPQYDTPNEHTHECLEALLSELPYIAGRGTQCIAEQEELFNVKVMLKSLLHPPERYTTRRVIDRMFKRTLELLYVHEPINVA